MAKVFLVQRCRWEPDGPNGYVCVHETGGGDPVCAFRDRERADEYRAQCEYVERIRGNPYAYQSGRFDPPLDEFTFARTLHDCGVQPFGSPWANDDDYLAWWSESARELTPADAMAAWAALGGGDFYEVVAVELEDGA